jgi:hypothetical protein
LLILNLLFFDYYIKYLPLPLLIEDSINKSFPPTSVHAIPVAIPRKKNYKKKKLKLNLKEKIKYNYFNKK